MPAREPSIPQMRHHKGSGQAAVVIGGKWHYLGKHGSPEAIEAYNRLIAEWLAGGRRFGNGPEDYLSVAELILAYWRHAERRYIRPDGKPKHELSAIRNALKPVRRLFGSTRARDFGPRALAVIQREFIAARYKRGIVNDQVQRVRRMFKWATANEMIPASVLHGLRAVDGLRVGESEAPEGREVKPVPQAYIDAVLPRVSRQVHAMIELQLLCGARPGEITMMRATDIDTTGKLWLYRPPRHKTKKFGKDRTIYFGPRAQEILREFLKPDVNAYLFSPRDADRERKETLRAARKVRLYPSEDRRRTQLRKRQPKRAPREHYTTDSYRAAIWRACDAAFPPPIPLGQRENETRAGWLARLTACQHQDLRAWREEHRWSPNQLRHNFGTRVRREFGVEVARVLLGHANVGTTEIYSERDAAVAANVIDKVG